MLVSLKDLYMELLKDRRYAKVPVEVIRRDFLKAVENELGLPAIVGDMFLEVEGYDMNYRTLDTLWTLIKANLRTANGWMTKDEAIAAGVWNTIKGQF